MCADEFCVEISMFSLDCDATARGHCVFAVKQDAEEYLLYSESIHVDSRKLVGREEINLYFWTK